MHHHQFIMEQCCPTDGCYDVRPAEPHSGGRGGAPISILFAAAVTEQQRVHEDYGGTSSCESPNYSSSAVDCTLSLGTPSTRHNNSSSYKHHTPTTKHYSGPLPAAFIHSVSAFDSLVGTKQTPPVAAAAAAVPGASHVLSIEAGRGAAGLKLGGGGGDVMSAVLLPRRCASCDTTSTPLWRNGPRGPKSLCNACGIRYKKEERRAASSVATQSCCSSSSASSAVARLESTTLPSLPQHHLAATSAAGYRGYHHPCRGYTASRLLAAAAPKYSCPSSAIDLSAAMSLRGGGRSAIADPMEAAGAALPYLPWQPNMVALPPQQAAEFSAAAATRFQDYLLHN